MKKERTRILVADDHQVVLGGVRSTLSEYPDLEIVGEATNGREAVRLAKILKPDLVIMDISMPDLNGIDATMQLKKSDPGIAIIIFSMYADREYVVDLLNAGISAYVLKEDPMSDLLLAINAVRAGEVYFSAGAPRIPMKHAADRESAFFRKESSFKELTLREREVLQLLAEGNGVKSIAVKLGVSPKTVESHKYSIMERLHVHSLAELTRIAVKNRLIAP